MNDVPAAIAPAKCSPVGAAAAIEATEHPPPASKIPLCRQRDKKLLSGRRARGEASGVWRPDTNRKNLSDSDSEKVPEHLALASGG